MLYSIANDRSIKGLQASALLQADVADTVFLPRSRFSGESMRISKVLITEKLTSSQIHRIHGVAIFMKNIKLNFN